MPRLTLPIAGALLLTGLLSSAQGLEATETVSVQQAGQVPPTTATGAGIPLRLVRRSASASSTSDAARTEYGEPIQLPAPKRTADRKGSSPTNRPAGGSHVVSLVLSSLAIVLGLFFLVVWVARRSLPKASSALPSDVLEVLGRSPLAARHNLQLIRLGRRLLLVSVTPETAETLSEITDPDEVNRLTGLCRENQPGSIAGSFRQALHQLATPTSGAGRVDAAGDSLAIAREDRISRSATYPATREIS